MDLSQIKAKLQQLDEAKQNGQGYEDFSDKFWKPNGLGTFKIRVVPSMYDPANPFTELMFHTKIRKYPILALTNLGQQDPVEELRQQLYESGNKDNWSLAGKLSPRPRYVVPVVVRGEEEKGVRLWEISQTVYKAFLQLAADDEIGDFTDVANGIDITVDRSQGSQYIETSIRAARKNSPLSDDPKLVEKWLQNQPKPVDCYTHCDYNYVKKQLQTFINGGVAPAAPSQASSNPIVEAGEKVIASGVSEMKLETSATNNEAIISKPVQPVKPVAPSAKNSMSKFDDLFGTDDTDDDE